MYEIVIQNGDVTEKLHERDETSLRRVSACKFTKGINQIPSAEITVFRQNPAYEHLIERQTILRIINTQTGKTAFEGRVLRLPDKGMDSSGAVSQSVICEGFLGYLCDSIQMYRKHENMRPGEIMEALLNEHNIPMQTHKVIHLGATIGGELMTFETDYKSTLEDIKRLISDCGGEISIRHGEDDLLYLDWTETPENDIESDTRIEIAVNMISMKMETDASNIITRLIPLGAQLKNEKNDTTGERLTIRSVNPNGDVFIDDEEAMAKYGIIEGTVIFDEYEPGHEAELMEAGRKHLKNNNRIKRSFRAEALDLSVIGLTADALEEGKTYRFTNDMIPIDEPLRVQTITIDIFEPYKPVMEIGDKTERITSLAARQAQLIEYELPKQRQEILASAKATASALVKAGFEGYVCINPEEILIMNHPDKTQATKVWRFNMGGLGYSSTGYNGEYGTAITMDGAIVADFITAGILRGMEIVNGNGKFHVHPDGTVNAAAIEITGGRINITSDSQYYDAINLNSGGWHSQTTPLQFHLKNDGENAELTMQAGGIYWRKDGSDNVIINSNGNIFGKIVSCNSVTCSTVTCDNASIWDSGSNSRFYLNSLPDTISTIYDRLADLGRRLNALGG